MKHYGFESGEGLEFFNNGTQSMDIPLVDDDLVSKPSSCGSNHCCDEKTDCRFTTVQETINRVRLLKSYKPYKMKRLSANYMNYETTAAQT